MTRVQSSFYCMTRVDMDTCHMECFTVPFSELTRVENETCTFDFSLYATGQYGHVSYVMFHSTGCVYMDTYNMNVFSDRNTPTGTQVMRNFRRRPSVNLDTYEVTICTFYHLSIWAFSGLKFVLYRTLE